MISFKTALLIQLGNTVLLFTIRPRPRFHDRQTDRQLALMMSGSLEIIRHDVTLLKKWRKQLIKIYSEIPEGPISYPSWWTH